MYCGKPVPPTTRKTRSHTVNNSMQSKTDDIVPVPPTETTTPAHLTVNEKGGRGRARGSGLGGGQRRRGSGLRGRGSNNSGRGGDKSGHRSDQRGPGRPSKRARGPGRPKKRHSGESYDASDSDDSIDTTLPEGIALPASPVYTVPQEGSTVPAISLRSTADSSNPSEDDPTPAIHLCDTTEPINDVASPPSPDMSEVAPRNPKLAASEVEYVPSDTSSALTSPPHDSGSDTTDSCPVAKKPRGRLPSKSYAKPPVAAEKAVIPVARARASSKLKPTPSPVEDYEKDLDAQAFVSAQPDLARVKFNLEYLGALFPGECSATSRVDAIRAFCAFCVASDLTQGFPLFALKTADQRAGEPGRIIIDDNFFMEVMSDIQYHEKIRLYQKSIGTTQLPSKLPIKVKPIESKGSKGSKGKGGAGGANTLVMARLPGAMHYNQTLQSNLNAIETSPYELDKGQRNESSLLPGVVALKTESKRQTLVKIQHEYACSTGQHTGRTGCCYNIPEHQARVFSIRTGTHLRIDNSSLEIITNYAVLNKDWKIGVEPIPRHILSDIVSRRKDSCNGTTKEMNEQLIVPSVPPANDSKALAMLSFSLEAYPTIEDFLAHLKFTKPGRNYQKYRSVIVDGIEAQTVGELLLIIRQQSSIYPSPGIAFIELIKYELTKEKFRDIVEEPSQIAASIFVSALEDSVADFEKNKNSN